MNAKGQGSPSNSYARPCCISNPISKYPNRTRSQQPKYQQPFLLPLFDDSLRSLALSSTDLTEPILSLTNQASQLFRALRNRKCQGRQTLHEAIPVFFISDPFAFSTRVFQSIPAFGKVLQHAMYSLIVAICVLCCLFYYLGSGGRDGSKVVEDVWGLGVRADAGDEGLN